MKRVKMFLLTALLILEETVGTLPVFASEEIKSVRIWIGVEGYGERQEPILTAESGNQRYEVENITLIDEHSQECRAEGPAAAAAAGGQEEALRMKNSANAQNSTEMQADEEMPSTYLCEIELAAEEGAHFATMQQSDIKLTGMQSTCSKAVRGNAGTSLVLTVDLRGLEERLGEIGKTAFSDMGIAAWEAAVHARAYQVQLYYEGKKKGLSHHTEKTEFDFSPLMTKAGVYHYKVIPLSAKGKKGAALETAFFRLSAVQAEKNETRWQSVPIGWQSGAEGMAAEKVREDDCESQKGIIAPGYRYSDGLYPQNTWLELDGIRCRFDSRGIVQEQGGMGEISDF